jgi:F420H(2)-dependent quinone reductase
MNILFKVFLAIQVGLYRLSGGRLGGTLGKFKVLLLTTKGRRSGKLRTTPLGFFERANGYVIVASKGGADHNPAWYLNLKSNPQVTIQVFERVILVTAEILSGEEREQAWQQVITTAPQYGSYQKKTTRQIPLILLHPINSPV